MSPLLPWRPLALKHVTFHLSPQPTFFQWVSGLSLLCCYGTRGLAAARWRCLVHQPVSSASQQTPRSQQWTCSRAVLKGNFTSLGHFWQHFSCQLQSFDRCRNGVKGPSRCLCTSGDMSEAVIPVCPGLFLQKLLRFNKMQTVSFYVYPQDRKCFIKALIRRQMLSLLVSTAGNISH